MSQGSKSYISKSPEFMKVDEDDDLDSEDLFLLDTVALEPPSDPKKAYETSFRSLDARQLIGMQVKILEHVSSILQIPLDLCRALLRAYRWDMDSTIGKATDSPEEAYKLAAITNLMDPSIKPVFSKKKSFACAICCDEAPCQDTLKLQCGDVFCLACRKTFYEQQISEGVYKILCPGACGTLVPDEVLKKIVSAEMFQRLESLQNNYFVEHTKNLKWCPKLDCHSILECDMSSSQTPIIPSVSCSSGHEFCFGCNLEEHMPCLCKIAKLWLGKCSDDSETSNWITSNTKECPRCHISIEKNGGCNNISCRKCQLYFCWHCVKSLTSHRRRGCNLYGEPKRSDADEEKSRLGLERYLHYYSRYDNHIQSSKLDQVLFYQTELKMESLQKSSLISWIEVQFLKDAAHTLLQCRSTLKWTYALAFYLEAGIQKSIFEDNQQDLEHATEELSGLLEQDFNFRCFSHLRQKVQDKACYVSQRRDTLLSFIIQSYTEEAWDYTTEV